MRIFSKASAAFVSGKAARPSLTPLGSARIPCAVALWIFVSVVILIPTLTLVVSSFQTNLGSLALADFGTRAWKYVLFDLMDFHTAVRTSLVASLLAALWVGCLAFWLSIAPGSKSRAVASRIEDFALLLYSMPGTSLALLLVALLAWMPGGSLLMNGVSILVVAYVLKYSLLGIRTVRAARELVHSSLIEVARLSGAGSFRIARSIWAPLLKPALGAAFVLVLLPCVSELTMSVLLYGPGTENLGVLLFQLQEYADRPAAAAVGTMSLVAVFLLQMILSRVEGNSTHES